MALSSRNGSRFSASIWPGFVDAMTALLLVMMFVLSIFVILQSVLRETIDTQDHQLDELGAQLAGLADALGLERQRSAQLQGQIMENESLIATLQGHLAQRETALAEAQSRISGFEALVATLRGQAEESEAARLIEAEAAAALRERLATAEDEMIAMTMALEEQRKRAEDTLTLLAAAEAARDQVEGQLSEAERQAALLSVANAKLAEEEAKSAESARRLALLNEQILALRGQLATLQGVLDEARARDEAAQVQIEALGSQLNVALAQVASEQRRRAELEAAERRRLEEEARQLERYRSDFFGKLREVLGEREGVRIVGDRFVFSSEVLFQPGSDALSAEGRSQIAGVVSILSAVADEIPPEIDWIIRVDGHTDDVPLSGQGQFADNWELSQARALSVVRYMIEGLGFAPERLAAAGFGEYRPVNPERTPEARAQNRRIELKLTER